MQFIWRNFLPFWKKFKEYTMMWKFYFEPTNKQLGKKYRCCQNLTLALPFSIKNSMSQRILRNDYEFILLKHTKFVNNQTSVGFHLHDLSAVSSVCWICEICRLLFFYFTKCVWIFSLEIMEQMALQQESAYERLYRWSQSECRAMTSDSLDILPIQQQAMKALQNRPVLFS